ncbi:MAG: efflux RND transporter permease subunit [Luteibaculaceae bacterium]
MEPNNSTQKYNEFKLSSGALKNRNTVIVLTILILFAGLNSYLNLPKESFPEIVIPEIYVGTPYPGNSALDIEKLITRPLEKEINTITGVDKITSTSIQGYSTVVVKFDFDVSPLEALRKVKDKVDIVKADPDFPNDLPADPNVFELNFSELAPIMNINLSGDFTIDELRKYAEYLEDKIEDLPEISKVEIRGVMDKEVRVEVDVYRMQAMEVSFDDIGNAIQRENVTVSGGDLLMGDLRKSVRVIGEFNKMTDLENLIVKQENFNTIYLKDIATVSFVEEEPESYAREFQQPVVMIDVMKRAGENLLIASDKIFEIIDVAQKEYFPSSLVVSVTGDQSDQTRSQVEELENSIIFGVILVVFVLLFFLGLRNALFVGIAIPLSMFLSFLILSTVGITLNMITLFSLILALGMLVDNGIVVVENIYRLRTEGLSPIEAAKQGVGEVAWPIVASTATTLAAFIPLAFWPGIFGEFMRYLPITLITVLSSSLFVALVINPVLTALYMKVSEDTMGLSAKQVIRFFAYIIIGVGLGLVPIKWVQILGTLLAVLGMFSLFGKLAFLSEKAPKKVVLLPGIGMILISLAAIFTKQYISGTLLGIAGTYLILAAYFLTPATLWFQRKLIPFLEDKYKNLLAFALRGRNTYYFFIGTFSLLFLSIGIFAKFPPSVLFFPENEPTYINVYIENPIGTDIEATDKIARNVEQRVINYLKKFEKENPKTGTPENFLVSSVICQVGQGTSDPAQGAQQGNTPHKARIQVSFVKFQERQGVSTGDVLEEIRDLIQDIPGTTINVAKNQNGPPRGAPINIELSGDDYDILMSETKRFKAFIEESGIRGIEELKLDVETGKPEMPIMIDRAKAQLLSLSTSQIGDAIRTSLFGKEVSTFKDGEEDYPIVIRFNEQSRHNADALLDQRIVFRDQGSGKIRSIPISSVAEAEVSTTYSAVKRKGLKRVITVSSDVLGGYNATNIVSEITELVPDFAPAPGINISFTGEQEEQAKEFAFLSSALLIAVFLIFMILVAQFNSAATPFIIVISVVLSLIGVLLGLTIFRMDFVILMTMIGIISLAGIVVNNAIVLIDYTDLLKERRKFELGMTKESRLPIHEIIKCTIEGGKTRLRPVLLTAITTILGLLPLATGLNINFLGLVVDLDPSFYVGGDNVAFWGPMSWAVIFGLTFATFLTLVIVPVMYVIMNNLQNKFLKNKVEVQEVIK